MYNPMKASPKTRSGRPSNARKMVKIVVWLRRLSKTVWAKNAVALTGARSITCERVSGRADRQWLTQGEVLARGVSGASSIKLICHHTIFVTLLINGRKEYALYVRRFTNYERWGVRFFRNVLSHSLSFVNVNLRPKNPSVVEWYC